MAVVGDPERDAPHEDGTEVVLEAGGIEEVGVVAWPLLLRRRLAARTPPPELSPSFVLAVALVGLFTVGFTVTLLTVSIPTIADDLHSTEATLTWVVTGPLLAFGVVGPALGKAGDVWGHKRIYLIGLTGAGVFALATAGAWDPVSLISFRVIGASLGAATGPTSIALLNHLFPPGARVKALGWWSTVSAGAPVLGVVAGGPVVEHFGWRWVFVAQAPLCGAAVLIAWWILPETERRARTQFDLAGAGLLALSVTSLLFALNRATAWSWGNPVVVVGFAISPLALWAFIRTETRAPDPLIPLGYFRNRNFAAPCAVQFFTNFAYMGGFVLTPLLLHDALGFRATKVGLLSISRPFAFAVTGPLAGAMTVRVGERRAGVTGALFVFASMIALSFIGVGSTDVFIAGALALSGVGLGCSSPAMVAAVVNVVDEEHYGVAGATQQLIAQVGVVAGIQVMQTVQQARLDSAGLVGSYSDAYRTGAAVCVIGALCALGIRRSRPPA